MANNDSMTKAGYWLRNRNGQLQFLKVQEVTLPDYKANKPALYFLSSSPKVLATIT